MSAPRTLLQIAGVAARVPAWTEAVLLLIDHQMEYIDGGVPLDHAGAAVHEMAALLRQARAANAPVVHVVHHARPGAALFDPNGPYVRIIPGLEPAGGESTIVKHLPNAFAGTDLDATLQNLGRKHLVLAGFATHMCISASVRAALDHGYHATVVAGACATRDLPAWDGGIVPARLLQQATLTALADRFAAIVPGARAWE